MSNPLLKCIEKFTTSAEDNAINKKVLLKERERKNHTRNFFEQINCIYMYIECRCRELMFIYI